ADLPTWRMAYGNALEGAGKYEDSYKAFEQVAEAVNATDKKSAGMAYYNAGLVAIRANKVDDAAANFDKAVAADPTKAEAYYQKGTALAAKMSYDKSGNLIVVPGTEEAFKKYLELQPNGP